MISREELLTEWAQDVERSMLVVAEHYEELSEETRKLLTLREVAALLVACSRGFLVRVATGMSDCFSRSERETCVLALRWACSVREGKGCTEGSREVLGLVLQGEAMIMDSRSELGRAAVGIVTLEQLMNEAEEVRRGE